MCKFAEIVSYIRDLYNKPKGVINLHEPYFMGNEKKYLSDCIDTTFVSSVGKYVNQFEDMCIEFTGSQYAIATMNGTAALHVSLVLSGVDQNCEVLTQPLTFIATANAISYTDAIPVFLDVDKDTLGLSPDALEQFLKDNCSIINGTCVNRITGKVIKACIPMHTFGFPCRIDRIIDLCDKHHIVLIEDSAESLGSYYKGKHTGTFGQFGVLSFNGNKTITCGGGGMILTNDKDMAKKAKHITTTAKLPHKWEYAHDMIAYNYRLTNLSAALGCAQMEQLPIILENKRKTARRYESFFEKDEDITFVKEAKDSTANYWLNTILLPGGLERDKLLKETNEQGVMTRPIWKPMNKLEMFKGCQTYDLTNSRWLEDRIVNIPSGVNV